MNINKLFLRWIAVFGIAIMFAVSGWGATLSISGNSTTEGDSTTGVTKNITLAVALNEISCTNSAQTITVKYQTGATGDTATAGSDYNAISLTTMTFYVTAKSSGKCDVKTSSTGTILLDDFSNNGLASQNVTVQIKSDIISELDEFFTVTLSAPSNATITTATAIGTIVDDDTAGNVFPTGNHRSFTQVASFNENGNLQMIGNSVLLKTGGVCPLASERNNDINTVNADVDSLSGDTTFNNSTTSDLSLPVGTTADDILWAGLYWQGYLFGNTDANKTAAKKISFRTPTMGSYTELTSDTDKFNWVYLGEKATGIDRFYYQGVKEVTSMVKTGLGGTYGVANLVTDIGNNDGGQYGAWSLVIIYKDVSASFKNLVVYDGYMGISGVAADLGWNGVSNGATISLSGFLTPTTGDFNATFAVFGGEGDNGYASGHAGSKGDFVSLSNSTGDVKLVNALNNIDDIFNSTISKDGVAVTARNPQCPNTIGIDLDTFDIGAAGQDIMQNGQTSTVVKLGSAGEAYFPGIFAFATDLYQPRVCYYEDVYKGATLLKDGAMVNKGDIIDVNVTVVNTQIETAQNLLVSRTFETSLPYVEGSAKIETVSKTDAFGDDQIDYNTTSKDFNARLGTGANAFVGGDLLQNQTSEFQFKATVNNDQNSSFSYNVYYTNGNTGEAYPGVLEKCVDFNNTFWGYNAPQLILGDFNVVYADHANGALSSGYYYNLPTQITSRADNYKVISLQAGTNFLKDVNASVAVELVDADGSNVCSERTVLSHEKTWVTFFDQNATSFSANDIIYGMMIYDADAAKKYYQKAAKNAAFRIKYPPTDSGGLITFTTDANGKLHLSDFPSYAGDTCVLPVTATTYNPANGNPQGEHTYTQVPEACGNSGSGGSNSGMTEHEMHVCLECIMGANPPSVCSKDTFAIRPEVFSLKLYDQNQTNSAVKQFMMNNTPSPANKDMASGYRYSMDVNATNHLGNASSLDYNTTEDVDFIWSSTQIGCNDDTNKSISFSFANGLADGNVSVDQVGEYRLSIIDTAWTAVDSNTSLMPHHTVPFFLVGTDCVSNSAVSSAVKTTGIGSSPVLNGCNVSTDHTNTTVGVTYTDSNVTFYPYKFDMSTINFGVGTLPQEINATSGPDFVYMSDMSRTDSMDMSLRGTGAISARGENNSTLSNFVNNCYAVDTNLSMSSYNNLTHPNSPNTTYQVRFVDTNGSGTVYDSNATDVATGALTMQLIALDDGNFTKDMSGSLNTVTRLNYDRNQTTPLDPMTVQYGALGFKCVTASECTMQADLSATHEAIGSKAMDFNVTHTYGRIIPRDVRVFGNVQFSANAWYEVYNMASLVGTPLSASKNEALWYISQLHNDSNDGDGSVTVIIPTTPLALPANSSSTTGVETYQFSAVPLANIPYSGKAHINTDPWLWYGINALGYADPGMNEDGTTDGTVDSDDCLHHPCFNINVVPAVGATGSAKLTNETTKASKKTDSGGGTWKSTSDYAPAIR